MYVITRIVVNANQTRVDFIAGMDDGPTSKYRLARVWNTRQAAHAWLRRHPALLAASCWRITPASDFEPPDR